MILVVCPAPALDITYRVDALVPGGAHRVRGQQERAGGKGVNVARVLRAIGADVSLVAAVGGPTGAQITEELASERLEAGLVPTPVPTRRTVTIVEPTGSATLLSEEARLGAWDDLAAAARAVIGSASVVVISGSFPADAPAGAAGDLVRACHDAGRPVIVDTSGAALADAIAACPTLVKPNAEELRALRAGEPVEIVRELAASYRTMVVASRGPEGVIASDGSQTWSARPGRVVVGNPTGAGDALVAGLAAGLERGDPTPAMLADAVALSATAVAAGAAGEVDLDLYADLRDGVAVTRVEDQP